MTGLRASAWDFVGTRVTVPQVMRQVRYGMCVYCTRLSKGSHVTSLLAAHRRVHTPRMLVTRCVESACRPEEGGGVPPPTRLWLAYWANRVVQQSNEVTTSYEITKEGGKSATAAFGAHLGEGASSRVFSCELSSELGKEPIVLKVLRPGHITEAPRELQLLRHFSAAAGAPP